ncbi:uncharacterized protein BHQ10_003486 [Talaromyces amestolkiae]|uniref:C2H2-type domain-containing protein n=1 Tax=Talaromyces amestolkiae TaxID=1196081 RepID=A0A364KVA1_TALAM|nr:uncharacterized protein BHQ10_003486 [Talaromyces amestolkiae]RAO67474.1 hypothetical protein BHQ10_003486 [Talaromyces amestolkiae]
MALKQIIGLTYLAALIGISFSSPVAPGFTHDSIYRCLVYCLNIQQIFKHTRKIKFAIYSEIYNKEAKWNGPVRPSSPDTASLSRSSSSLISTKPNGSTSLIIQTVTEPNGPVVTVTLPASASITGLETLTISSSALTVEPISITSSVSSPPSVSTSNVETFTEPNGSSVVLTLPPGSTLSGFQTLTTGGETLTIQPVPTPTTSATITSTMTTAPAELSIEPFTATPVTGNMWLTTTGSDHSTTIVPIILPCPTCEPQIIWNVPEIPDVEFTWPSFPQLPKFHLPCVKIFGITISGSCPDPSGPTPENDAPPESPEPTNSPTSSPSSDSPSSTRLSTTILSSSSSSSTSSSSSGSSSSTSELIGLQRNTKRARGPLSVNCTNCDVEFDIGLWQLKHRKPDIIHGREYRHLDTLLDTLSNTVFNAFFDTFFNTLLDDINPFDNPTLFTPASDNIIYSAHHDCRAYFYRVRKLLCLNVDNHALRDSKGALHNVCRLQ